MVRGDGDRLYRPVLPLAHPDPSERGDPGEVNRPGT